MQPRDKTYLKISVSAQREIERKLRLLSKRLQAKVRAELKSPNPDLQALEVYVNKQFDKEFTAMSTLITDTQTKVAARKAIIEIARVKAARKSGTLNIVERQFILFKENAERYEDRVSRSFRGRKWGDNLTFAERVKYVRDGSKLTVHNIIVTGVEQGKSAAKIAEEIRQYVIPVDSKAKLRPFDVARQRFGKAASNAKIPSGSVQYNAIRIARTETARTYREASLNFYRGRDWVLGYRWVLSNSHPRDDVCDEYASEVYPDEGSVPNPHPNCQCDVQPILRGETADLTKEQLRTLEVDDE